MPVCSDCFISGGGECHGGCREPAMPATLLTDEQLRAIRNEVLRQWRKFRVDHSAKKQKQRGIKVRKHRTAPR